MPCAPVFLPSAPVAGEQFDDVPDLDEAIALTAKFPGILAAFFRLRQGLEPVTPKIEHNTAQSYLYQLFDREPDEKHWRPLEVYLTLLADHGMNASTFTARVIASTGSDLCSARDRRRRRVEGSAPRRRAIQSAGHAGGDRLRRKRRSLADGGARPR